MDKFIIEVEYNVVVNDAPAKPHRLIVDFGVPAAHIENLTIHSPIDIYHVYCDGKSLTRNTIKQLQSLIISDIVEQWQCIQNILDADTCHTPQGTTIH